jgi:phage protein D
MTALLRPAYVLRFRDPGGAGGGLAGIGLGHSGKVVRSVTTPGTSTVAELHVELDMTDAADRVRLLMGQVGTFKPTVGQQLSVELGFTDGGDPQQVTVCNIIAVQPDLRHRRIVGLGSADTLQHTFVDRAFEHATAGSIVEELVAGAGLQMAKADDGITFPAYVIDAQRSAHRHIGELARLCGFDYYVDNEGKVVFAFFTGGRTSHVFEHGKHILEVRLHRRPSTATKVRALGESPGAARGDNSWSWFAKDLAPFSGTAGSGDRLLLLERSALRTGVAAQQAAQAALTELVRAATAGELLVTGAPQVRLGDALRLSGVPEPGVDGTYQVRSVAHDIDKNAGFTTRVGFRSIEIPGVSP